MDKKADMLQNPPADPVATDLTADQRGAIAADLDFNLRLYHDSGTLRSADFPMPRHPTGLARAILPGAGLATRGFVSVA